MKLFALDELKKFRDETVDHIHFMSKWCHLTKIDDDKIRFREIKRRWLKLLDDNDLIDRMCYQMTPTNDKLIWFHVGERSFHQRAKHYPTTRKLEVHPDLHLKDDEISIDTIDTSFWSEIDRINVAIHQFEYNILCDIRGDIELQLDQAKQACGKKSLELSTAQFKYNTLDRDDRAFNNNAGFAGIYCVNWNCKDHCPQDRFGCGQHNYPTLDKCPAFKQYNKPEQFNARKAAGLE